MSRDSVSQKNSAAPRPASTQESGPSGPVALVTGASRGIGRGIATVLAGKGYDIAFSYHTSREDALELQQNIQAMGRKCVFYQAVLETSGVAEQLCASVLSDLGRIDVLVCNAGKTRYGSVLTMEEKDVDFLYGLNFRSYLMCAKYAAHSMIDRQVPGRIIFISSTRGQRAYPEDLVYGSLKAGLNRAVQSLALELAEHRITVNSIAPGATKVRGDLSPEGLTQGFIPTLVPLGRYGSPEEVGHLAAYLASPEAAYITGQTIYMDGGLILPGQPEQPERSKQPE